MIVSQLRGSLEGSGMLTHSADLGVGTNKARQPNRLWLMLEY